MSGEEQLQQEQVGRAAGLRSVQPRGEGAATARHQAVQPLVRPALLRNVAATDEPAALEARKRCVDLRAANRPEVGDARARLLLDVPTRERLGSREQAEDPALQWRQRARRSGVPLATGFSCASIVQMDCALAARVQPYLQMYGPQGEDCESRPAEGARLADYVGHSRIMNWRAADVERGWFES